MENSEHSRYNFEKILTKKDLEENRLVIPENTAAAILEKGLSELCLQVNCSLYWTVHINKDFQEYCIGEGWSQLCNVLSMNEGFVIKFAYSDRNKYNVSIIDSKGNDMSSTNILSDSIYLKLRKQQKGFDPKIDMYVVANRIGEFKRGSISVCSGFYENKKEELPVKIKIRTPNGSEWNGSFVKELRRIVFSDAFMETHGVMWKHPIHMKFFGDGLFECNIYSPLSVEVRYDIGCSSETRQLQSDYFKDNFVIANNFAAQYYVNAFTFELMPIRFELNSDDVKDIFDYLIFDVKKLDHCCHWKNGAVLNVFYGKKIIRMMFEQFGDLCRIHGWNELTTIATLNAGDLCILQPYSDSINVEVCFIGKTDLRRVKTRTGYLDDSLNFYRVLNGFAINTGEISLPPVLYESIGDSIPPSLTLDIYGRRVFNIRYSSTFKRFIGLKNIFNIYKPHEGAIMFFNYVSNRHMSAVIFRGMEISRNVHLFDASVSPLKIEDNTNEANAAQFIPMEMSVSVEVEFDMFVINAKDGLYEETVKEYHLDGKSHGLYVTQELKPIYKKWKNGSVGKLALGSNTWPIRISRRGNICRLEGGWSQFCSDANMVFGEVFRYKLESEKPKFFRFYLHRE